MNKTESAFKELINLNQGIFETCRILDDINISCFSHVRLFNDGTAFCLCTRPEIIIQSMESGLYKHARYSNESMILKPGFELWLGDNQGSFENPHRQFLLQQGVGNGITLVSKSEDYVDLFHFASDPENKAINNFYINNTQTLKNFTDFYLDDAKDIIHEAEKHTIPLIPNWDVKTQLQFTNTEEAFNKLHDLFQAYAEDTPTLDHVSLRDINTDLILNIKNSSRRNFLINRGQMKASISRREAQCVLLMLKGKNMREAANILQLSPRTTQNYIDNIKNKLGCKKRSELLDILLHSQFLEQIFE